jgi:hypothetical protein
MLAVTMMTTRIVLPLSLLVAACGGAAPTHTGYPEGEAAPWDKAAKLRLSDNGEASADGTLSFPDRQRAKWYLVELPTSGTVTARMTLENRAPGTDVALEILDAGFNVNVPGESDDDVGQPKKTREYKDARPGKTYVHIYLLGRNDRAEYSVRVHFDPKPQAPGRPDEPAVPTADKSSFPWTVPNLPALAQINASDDTPLHGKTRVATPTPPTPPKPEEPPPDTGPSVKATITEFSDTGSGIKIVINKGANANIEQGWDGYVVSGGKPLAKSNFKIRAVRDTESEAVVRVTLDDIQKNHTVVLKPPK